jgi:hypothetical protein
LKFFDDAYKICESPSLTLILGKAHYYYVKKEYSESLDILNNGLASSWLSITLSLEKLKVQVASEEWDLALETARKYFVYIFACNKQFKPHCGSNHLVYPIPNFMLILCCLLCCFT